MKTGNQFGSKNRFLKKKNESKTQKTQGPVSGPYLGRIWAVSGPYLGRFLEARVSVDFSLIFQEICNMSFQISLSKNKVPASKFQLSWFVES
jgi:hypothetical protein